MHRVLLPVLALCAAAPAFAQAPVADAACEGLAKLALPQATVAQATVERSGIFHEAQGPGGKPRDHAGLPPFCRVLGTATPVPKSKIGFEIWLPLGGWSGRLQAIGNGAYDSRIYYAQMAQRVRAGDVVVATDTGHKGGDLKFGVGNTEAIVDWGTGRAVHESTVAAKQVATALFGQAPRYAYFAGCSTGGHQALAAAQRYPDDYDGIIAGDPGNNRTNLNLTFLWHFQKNHARGDNATPILTPDKLRLVHKAAIDACDALDGVKDGVINDPRQCRFDVASLACKPGEGDEAQCLSPTQVEVMKAMYAGPTDVRTGKPLYAPFLPGSEGSIAKPSDRHPGWSAYWANPRKPDEPQRIDTIRLWVYDDPAWNWWNFDWGKDIDTVRAKLSPMIDATDPPSAFQRRGGKLILFMGWDDPVGAASDIVGYYERLAEPANWARLYMVPGMVHCAEGPGATNFSTATRDSVPPVSDARHDMGVALRDWVEKGQAPKEIVATRFEGPEATEGKGRIAFQRPLCPWPQVARYLGGPTEKAESFACGQ